MTFATKQDGSREIVDSRSFYVPKDAQTSIYEAQKKARTDIHIFFSTESIGNQTLDNIVEACMQLPGTIAYIEGSAVREVIVKMFISHELKHYIDKKETS